MNRPRLALLSAGLLASFPGCERAELAVPPELRLGRDECGECGMLIIEDRCAAAKLVEVGGRREHILFDDIACMIDHDDAAEPGARALDRYVRDYGGQSWFPADQAVFVLADPDRVQTPMGSGIIAFAAEEAALAKAREVEAKTARYADLAGRHEQASTSETRGHAAPRP